jgi:hypothetical protein
MRLELQPDESEVFDLAEVQPRCLEHVTFEQFYAQCGNDYRGEFQAMQDAWGREGGVEIVSKVAYGHAVALHVHLRTCAWLDACLHAPYWWSHHRSRPFYVASVTSYAIRAMSTMSASQNEVMWSLSRGLSGSDVLQPDMLKYYDEHLRCRVQIDGSRLGFFEIGWLEGRRTKRHLYEVLWEATRADVPTSTAERRLMLCNASSSATGRHPSTDVSMTRSASTIILWCPACGRPAHHADELPIAEDVLALFVLLAASPVAIWIVTMATLRTVIPTTRSRSTSAHAGLWGLSRAVRQEMPTMACWNVDADDSPAGNTGALKRCGLQLKSPSEPELAERVGAWLVPRLMAMAASIAQASAADTRGPLTGTHAITGGTGALGALTARWLGDIGVNRLILLSRSGKPAIGTQATCEIPTARRVQMLVVRGDVADECAIMQLASSSLRGVWHTAGVLSDAIVARQTAHGFCRVFAPKVHGATSLHRLHHHLPSKDAFMLFSSIAALIYSAGQANYAAANSCLDAVAIWASSVGVMATSVQSGWRAHLHPRPPPPTAHPAAPHLRPLCA